MFFLSTKKNGKNRHVDTISRRSHNVNQKSERVFEMNIRMQIQRHQLDTLRGSTCSLDYP